MNLALGSLFVMTLSLVGATHENQRAVGDALTAEPASKLEAALLNDAADQRFDNFSLLEASLVASGIESTDEMSRYTRLFDSRYATLVRTLPSGTRPMELRAQSYQVFRTLFTTGRYDLQCSSPARTLRTGDYNCVSATVLYLELVRRLGEPAVASALPSHVRVQLLSEPILPVETTAARWLGDAVNAKSEQKCRPLSDAALIGKIYYNRASAEIEAHQFASAVNLLSIACSLDADDTAAHDNRSAAMNNWAIQLSRQGELDRAEALLLHGVKIDPSYRLFEVNLRHVRGLAQ